MGFGRLILTSCAVLLATGCGGDGGGGGTIPPGLSGTFTASGTSASANQVRLRSGTPSGDLVSIEVAIGGPSVGGLYAFAFDLVLSDPAVVEVQGITVPSSGGALTAAAGQTLHAEAAKAGDRIVVGVTKLGGGAGNAVSAAEAVVATLVLRVLQAGTTTVTFAGSSRPGDPPGPVALDESGGVIAAVVYDASTRAAVTAR
jgi:hypothetical protein